MLQSTFVENIESARPEGLSFKTPAFYLAHLAPQLWNHLQDHTGWEMTE